MRSFRKPGARVKLARAVIPLELGVGVLMLILGLAIVYRPAGQAWLAMFFARLFGLSLALTGLGFIASGVR